MDLLNAAWMIRDLGESVSALVIDENNSIIAGGWNGRLKKWDSKGDLIWELQCSDRINAAIIKSEYVIVADGLHISTIKNGNVEWSHPLEGSADLLTIHKDSIIATSSVYDIEHGDFMESGIWRFSFSGNLLEHLSIDEKPWFIDGFDDLVVGLGRPRCGILIGDEHQDLKVSSPVTCGIRTPTSIFTGHVDGSIFELKKGIFANLDSPIHMLSFTTESLTSSDENGVLTSFDYNCKTIWEASGNQITTHAYGFEGYHWCGRFSEETSTLEVRERFGEVICNMESTRLNVFASSQNRVAAGFEDGKIIVWESEMFERRKNSQTQISPGNSILAAKLRSLRDKV